MSLRTFVDPDGKEWEVLAIVPREEERRHYDRRSGEVDLDADAERREYDRRLTVGGAERIAGGRGWLTFMCGEEKRRLTPIPEDWTHATDERLAEYLRLARPVRQSSNSNSVSS